MGGTHWARTGSTNNAGTILVGPVVEVIQRAPKMQASWLVTKAEVSEVGRAFSANQGAERL